MNTTYYTTAVWAEGTPSVNFFVAPKTGWYFLAASGTHDSGGTDGKAYQINLRVNGNITVGGRRSHFWDNDIHLRFYYSTFK